MPLAKVTLIGNVGREPELRMTPDGKSVADFSIAVSRKGKEGEVTDWYRISAWGRTGEICQQYVHKGHQLYIEGRLSVSRYTAKDGETRLNLDVNADTVVLLKNDRTSTGAAAPGTFDPDETPF